MKFLCLHGSQQTSEIFRSRLGKLPGKLLKLFGLNDRHAALVFLDGPVELALREGDQVVTRTWRTSSGDTSASMQLIRSVWSSQGPFDAVIGFSMGGIVATLMCLCADEFPGLKCVVVAGSSAPPQLSKCTPGTLAVPSLHIVGSSDPLVIAEDARHLAGLFVDSTVYEHTGGHCFPSDAACHSAVIGFLQQHLPVCDDSKKVTTTTATTSTTVALSADSADEQREEMEALPYIYHDALSVICGAPAGEGQPCGVFEVTLTKEDGLQLTLHVEYPGLYPENPPSFSIKHEMDLRRFSQAAGNDLLEHVSNSVGEAEGMPCVFGAVSAADAWFQDWSMPTTSNSKEPESLSEGEDSIPEQSEEEMIARATLEACQYAGNSVLSAAEGRGVTKFIVGLVGKPSAGKSTFFNCVTRLQQMAKVSPHPFTTIEPNIGTGWWASNDQLDTESLVETQHGRDAQGRRLLPLLIKDVAGLIPGAYKGHGKGNRFLNDLCDADVLIHVVDVSGQADKNGVTVVDGDGGSTAGEDVAWVREELHRWIHGNVAAKWNSVLRLARQGTAQAASDSAQQRVYALFSGYQGPRSLLTDAINRADLKLQHVVQWTSADLHRLVAHFLSCRFPMVLALNKCDVLLDDTTRKVEAAREMARGHGYLAVVCSAKTEECLLSLAGKGHIEYQLGDVSLSDSAMKTNSHQEDSLRDARRVLDRFGSTGVLQCVSEAVSLRQPVLIYPKTSRGVGSSSNSSSSRKECLQALPGVTVYEVFEALKRGSLNEYRLEGEFVRAEARGVHANSPLKQIGRDTKIDSNSCVLKILTNRKVQWQSEMKN